MSLPVRAAAVFVALGLVLSAAAAMLIFPPEPLLRAAARRSLPDSVVWEDAERSGTRCSLLDVEIAASGPLRVRAERVTLTRTVLGSLLSGTWHFEARGIEIASRDGRWPSLRIPSGAGQWSSAERRLLLPDWGASGVRVTADARWAPDGSLSEARLSGAADPGELAKLLSAWKRFAPDAAPEELPFTIVYEREKLLITVDEKPFFRASWSSNASF